MTRQFFTPTPGHDNCPKCFGWQVRDFTPRDFKGWPTGPADIRDCDHCGGRGEVLAKVPVNAWNSFPAPPPLPPSPIVIDDAVPPPSWPGVIAPVIEPPLRSGWPASVPTHSTEHVASGWPKVEQVPFKVGQMCGGCGKQIVQDGWTGTRCGCNL